MGRIAVYRYLLLDDASRQWRKQPAHATRQHVERLGGALIFHTKLEVDEADIRDGIYEAATRPV